ncbi:unnamed protein product, partial [Closterium sp. Naga37s-1]
MQRIVDHAVGVAKESVKAASREAFHNTANFVNSASALVLACLPNKSPITEGLHGSWDLRPTFRSPRLPAWMAQGGSSLNAFLHEFVDTIDDFHLDSSSNYGNGDDENEDSDADSEEDNNEDADDRATSPLSSAPTTTAAAAAAAAAASAAAAAAAAGAVAASSEGAAAGATAAAPPDMYKARRAGTAAAADAATAAADADDNTDTLAPAAIDDTAAAPTTPVQAWPGYPIFSPRFGPHSRSSSSSSLSRQLSIASADLGKRLGDVFEYMTHLNMNHLNDFRRHGVLEDLQLFWELVIERFFDAVRSVLLFCLFPWRLLSFLFSPLLRLLGLPVAPAQGLQPSPEASASASGAAGAAGGGWGAAAFSAPAADVAPESSTAEHLSQLQMQQQEEHERQQQQNEQQQGQSRWQQQQRLRQAEALHGPRLMDARTCEDIIRDAGYPYEAIKVVTEDGYVLTLERIPRKDSSRVVFLQHGILDSSIGWVSNGVVGSQAFAAYDQGFDVFLGNMRGYVTRQHVDLRISASRYWNYSVNEHGMCDIRAMIDCIHHTKIRDLAPPPRPSLVPPPPSLTPLPPNLPVHSIEQSFSQQQQQQPMNSVQSQEHHQWRQPSPSAALDALGLVHSDSSFHPGLAVQSNGFDTGGGGAGGADTMYLDKPQTGTGSGWTPGSQTMQDGVMTWQPGWHEVRPAPVSLIDALRERREEERREEERRDGERRQEEKRGEEVRRMGDGGRSEITGDATAAAGTTGAAGTTAGASEQKQQQQGVPWSEEQPYHLQAVAHSLGGAAMMIYLVTQLIRKQPHRLSRLILLSPAGYHEKTPLLFDVMLFLMPYVDSWLSHSVPAVYIPTQGLRLLFNKLAQDFQNLPALRCLVQVLISNVLVGGDSSDWVGALRQPHYNMYNMPGIAYNVMKHLALTKRERRFIMFDYGSPAANLAVYGSPEPVDIGAFYRLIDIPIDVVAGRRDRLIPREMVHWHYKTLKAAGRQASYREFEYAHLDFTFAHKEELLAYVMRRLRVDLPKLHLMPNLSPNRSPNLRSRVAEFDRSRSSPAMAGMA